MKAALFLKFVLPPPPSGPNILAGFDGPGTGFTSNTWETPVMQQVIRDIVLLYIIPYILDGPPDQRIDLHQAVVGIPLHQLVEEPGNRLVLP